MLLYLLHVEYQNTHSATKVQMILGNEHKLKHGFMVEVRFKGVKKLVGMVKG